MLLIVIGVHVHAIFLLAKLEAIMHAPSPDPAILLLQLLIVMVTDFKVRVSQLST